MPEINDSVFKIEELQHNASQITASLNINKNSSIFEGHFPGQPVVPGACMLQLVKDVLEEVLHMPILLKKAGNIKFINMITPANNLTAKLTISYKITDDGSISINAILLTGEVTCFKLQAVYIKL
ncbi:MAG: FabA-like domain protein [Mucilaginibacter sp.]|nr:FabA-like domain protein [Mucilaginibacter sp.]